MIHQSIPFAIVFACSLFIVTGCENPAGSADDHGPKLSLKETLVKVNKLATKIGEGFADGEGEKAHDPLHELLHLLEGVPKMVDESSLSDDDKTTLKGAVNTLEDNFGKVDAKMHGDPGSDYSEVKEQVEEALASLNKISESMK